MSDSLVIRPLEASDHSDWRRLWTDYLTFYETTLAEQVYASTWKRLFDGGDLQRFELLSSGRSDGCPHLHYHRSA